MLTTQLLGYEVGTGRLVPTVAAVLGLVSVAAAAVAVSRLRRAAPGTGARASAAVVTGVLAVAVGGLHAAQAEGGVGTGNGLAGAVVAVVLGAAGLVGGAVVLLRAGTSRTDRTRARSSV